MARGIFVTRQRNAEGTKQVILQAAEIEFAEKGLSGARVDEIAARAGVNKALLYQYFGNKEELYGVVLDTIYRSLGERENRIIEQGTDCIEEIRALIRAYFYFLKDNPAYVRMLMWENLNYGKTFGEKKLGDAKNVVINELIRILNRGKEKGIINADTDPEQILQTLIACSFNYFSNRYTLEQVLKQDMTSRENMERRIESVTEMVLLYIGNRPSSLEE